MLHTHKKLPALWDGLKKLTDHIGGSKLVTETPPLLQFVCRFRIQRLLLKPFTSYCIQQVLLFRGAGRASVLLQEFFCNIPSIFPRETAQESMQQATLPDQRLTDTCFIVQHRLLRRTLLSFFVACQMPD